MTVSIVVAAVSGERLVANCLASIRRVAGDQEVEIIVLRGEPTAVFELRAQGIALANGTRVAVVGDRYEVTSGWLGALLEDDSCDVVGGCVAPGPRLSYWGWSVYLSEYLHVAPPTAKGEAHDAKLIPGGNVVYRTALLRRLPPDRTDTDLSFHARLLKVSRNAVIRADLEVLFTHPPSFSEYVHERFWYSRVIASRDRGIERLLVAPLLPLVVLWRTGWVAMRKPRYFLRYLLCAPTIACFACVQAVGEWRGVWEGRSTG